MMAVDDFAESLLMSLGIRLAQAGAGIVQRFSETAFAMAAVARRLGIHLEPKFNGSAPLIF